MSLTASAIVAEYGAFYKKGTQGEKDLMMKLYRGAEFDAAFTYTPTEDTVIHKVTVSSDPVLQAFQKSFTPKGGATFEPMPINLRKVKADDDFHPDDIEATYIGFLASNNLDRKEWPISRWYVEKVLMQQFIQDIDDNAYKAVYSAPTEGTAGAANAAFNGFKKVLIDNEAAGRIPTANILTTGTIPTNPADFVTWVEALVEAIPDDLRKRLQLGVHMSHAFATRYVKGMRAKYNANYLQETELMKLADYKNVSVAGFSAMTGESGVFIAPKANLILGMKRPTELVRMESNKRKVDVYTDHWRGYGVADGRFIWLTNNIIPE
ncbi:hypothetical protein UFOVP350_19 [uncultured Caudovirales phage]|uniref:Uncharacterized protein n=1 Tax=uncultured Caudovirales phage TaxID=2100421 RepID=A0A6J5LW69_9CAUD|nr:hypothetical protein UFOVP350_19 [uncultured Caudovirales phage]